MLAHDEGRRTLAPLEAAASLVDKRFGPILQLFRQRLGGDEPPWFLCTARMARYPIGAMYNDSALTSDGTSLYSDEADARALSAIAE